MIREHLFQHTVSTDKMFRWRGGEISRLEGLSDGVFAVTLTLLIVSTSVPTTFYEMWNVIRDLPVFLVCFLSLMMAWRYHYLFFRRYGLEDFLTNALNALFLFLILFYAYPLKFLATFLWRGLSGANVRAMFEVPKGVAWMDVNAQLLGMMYFFDFAYIAVFGLLAMMHVRAYWLREELQLDELELFLTRATIRSHLLSVSVGVLSLFVLVFCREPGAAGLVFFLIGPIHTFEGFYTGSKSDAIGKRLQAEE